MPQNSFINTAKRSLRTQVKRETSKPSSKPITGPKQNQNLSNDNQNYFSFYNNQDSNEKSTSKNELPRNVSRYGSKLSSFIIADSSRVALVGSEDRHFEHHFSGDSPKDEEIAASDESFHGNDNDAKLFGKLPRHNDTIKKDKWQIGESFVRKLSKPSLKFNENLSEK